jgi:hypothetical protein
MKLDNYGMNIVIPPPKFNRGLTGGPLVAYKAMFTKFSDLQHDIIIGTLLGDSTMGLRSGVRA